MTAPRIRQVVIDCEHPRAVAEFYRALFPELAYRPGDEPPAADDPDPLGRDWLVLRGPGLGLAFQAVADNPRPTWPSTQVPQQVHLDTTVPDLESLAAARERVHALGGGELLDRTADDDEPLVVFTDPAGHPFCVFVAAD